MAGNNYSVYMHVSPNNKKYIGITGQEVKRRWQNGLAYRKNKHFYSAIEKYGWNSFRHLILFEKLSEDEAKIKEIELISFYKSANREFGYNNSVGGESSSGKKLSKESCKRMSIARTGIKLSEEHKRHISEGSRGKKMSLHFCEFMSNLHKNKIVSEETRKLISEKTKLGMTKEVREKISRKVICLENKEVFGSMTEAGNKYNLFESGISNCCRGVYKKSGGYHWQYYDTYLEQNKAC